LVELDAGSLYHLTPLGRLAGVSGVEVESLIRVIDAFTGIDPGTLSDPSLIAATQLTVELDQVLFPINRKSTQKEPQTWFNELRQQGVLGTVMRGLSRSVAEQHQPALRAKKAVACLLWISGKPMSEVEDLMTQFGGKFDGAAGPMRSVKSRTCDVLPVVAKVGELLHPNLNLGDRVQRLLFRLELGLPAAAVDLARYARDQLSRGDYLRLIKAGVGKVEALEAAGDEVILACVDGDRAKLAVIRNAVESHRAVGPEVTYTESILPPYEA
ncbi:MAG: DEAD/DEAH box helicase, partial [Chloroflexota bacterium]